MQDFLLPVSRRRGAGCRGALASPERRREFAASGTAEPNKHRSDIEVKCEATCGLETIHIWLDNEWRLEGRMGAGLPMILLRGFDK